MTDGAYTAMVAAIREDRTPNLLLMRYALATLEVRDLLLIPSFMLTAKAPSAPSSEKRNSKPWRPPRLGG